jgi:hypothetical protein
MNLEKKDIWESLKEEKGKWCNYIIIWETKKNNLWLLNSPLQVLGSGMWADDGIWLDSEISDIYIIDNSACFFH